MNIYFYEIEKISKQCDDLNLLLIPSKALDILNPTAKHHTSTLVLNGTNIILPDKVKYLDVLVDQNLRFHEHVQSVHSHNSIKKNIYCEGF